MKVEAERLDHLPVIAGTIKEIGLIEKIDALIPPHEDEIVSTASYCCFDHLRHGLSTKAFVSNASLICQEQGIAQNVVHGDTTSFSFDGQYDLEEDEDPVVTITNGYSKDHRPDLKQIVLEMAVSPDGGVPVLMAGVVMLKN